MRVGFPIRKSADQRSLASPRSLSQRATSFIASWRQGIHRTLLSRSILPPMPARRTKPHAHSSAALTKMPSYYSIHSHAHGTTPAPTHRSRDPHMPGRSRDQPIRFTCQTSRSPAQTPKDPTPDSKPVVQNALTPHREPPKGGSTQQETQDHGDGRYRTDGPLLAKQVLYH